MTKQQIDLAKAAIKARKEEVQVVDTYKEVLQMFKDANVEWSAASKDTLKVVNPNIIKATREDYRVLNSLRDWYTGEEL